MMRRIFLILILVLLPSICLSDEFVLVMSKEDNLCQHMLKLYNEDLKKYGKIKYDEHEEFNWIKWEEKQIRLRPPSYPQNIEEIHARITFFDINNDLKNDVIVHRESMLSSQPMDVYEIFRYEDLEMLNEIIDGSKYYTKTLKSFDSNAGVPVNIYDLSKADIKKLPERMKDYIAAAKKRGDKVIFYVDGDKINYLKHNNRFYISYEESNDHTYHGDGGQYSIISELLQDNTLKNQCLYLIKKDKPYKRRTK